MTAAARAAFNGPYFESKVDPDGLLPESERLRRAEFARRAHFVEMARRSALKRSRKTVAP
jgi:hypothetical protein